MSGHHPIHDQTGRIVRAIVRDAARYGLAVTAAIERCRPWESATFSGGRYTVRVVGEGDLADWLGNLPESELAVVGSSVVDLAVIDRSAIGAVIELLTVRD